MSTLRWKEPLGACGFLPCFSKRDQTLVSVPVNRTSHTPTGLGDSRPAMRTKAACAIASRTDVLSVKRLVLPTSVMNVLLLSGWSSLMVVNESPMAPMLCSSAYASEFDDVRGETQLRVNEEALIAAARVGTRTMKYLGRARYICTPSGFGRRSRCFLRPWTRIRTPGSLQFLSARPRNRFRLAVPTTGQTCPFCRLAHPSTHVSEWRPGDFVTKWCHL